ncbi:Crp/Fnr family transcriptional regulator [Reyranella sp.]|uniref:Crp/Fnr family transcriptional regulator n=1 Tax=Reyranella sp. TaxID=1929291 RepID=UPI003D0C9C10
MTGMLKRSGRQFLGPLREKLRSPGGAIGKEVDAVLNRTKPRIGRGEIIAGPAFSGKQFAVLLEGLACMATRNDNGARQIYAFYYPGDFLALHDFLRPESREHIEIEALSNCSIGTINRDILERAIQRRPMLGQALWQAAMIEARIFRQRLVMARWPALQRVAHLLCEQRARLGAHERVIPLTQIDVADATGLSVVHINRLFQELRQLGVLSKQRTIKVVNKERLQELAAFDPGYLDPGEALSYWDLYIDD